MKKDYSYYYTLPEACYENELKQWFRKWTSETLDLENPKTFNEKIQWLKLYDSTSIKTKLADKYLVREWVAERIGEEYLIPLLGVWDSFDEIDFDALPDQFVLKANHGSGYNYIVEDKAKFCIEDARKKFERWIREEFSFRNGIELHYLNTPKCIVAEEYIQNNGNDLYDYKVFCFDGKAECILFISNRKTGVKRAFFDTEWNRMQYDGEYGRNDEKIPAPDNLQTLIGLAEKLSKGFSVVRVDFYRLDNGEYFFGEMTFTPAGGRMIWGTPEQNIHFGDMINLPERSALPERKPIVSVIMTSYSSENRLRKTLDTLLMQPLQDIEILCMDDHSDDAIAALLTGYAEKDDRIHIIATHKQDAAAVKNTALDTACGEFITFVYPDDEIIPEYLMTLAKRIIDQRADIVIGNGVYKYTDGTDGFELIQSQEILRAEMCSSADVPVSFLASVASIHNIMIRRDFLDQKRLRCVSARAADDICFAFSALNACERITIAAEKMICIRECDPDLFQLLDEVDTAGKQYIGDRAARQQLMWLLCLKVLKQASGESYKQIYMALRRDGIDRLGLRQAEELKTVSRARYRQLQAMLESDVMIRFE